MLHVMVEPVCKYASFLGYPGLIVVALYEICRAEYYSTKGLVGSCSNSSDVDPNISKAYLAFYGDWRTL